VTESELVEQDARSADRRAGVLLGVKLHLIGAAVLVIVSVARPSAFVGTWLSFCLWQWLYLLPAMIMLYARKSRTQANAVLTVGLLTMALEALVIIVWVVVFCGNVGR
jgi:hypothetical protein